MFYFKQSVHQTRDDLQHTCKGKVMLEFRDLKKFKKIIVIIMMKAPLLLWLNALARTHTLGSLQRFNSSLRQSRCLRRRSCISDLRSHLLDIASLNSNENSASAANPRPESSLQRQLKYFRDKKDLLALGSLQNRQQLCCLQTRQLIAGAPSLPFHSAVIHALSDALCDTRRNAPGPPRADWDPNPCLVLTMNSG